MMLPEAIATLLAADTTLAGLLPGGVYGTVSEISKEMTPAAFNADGDLIPCLLVRASTFTPDASGIPGAARYVVRLFFYELFDNVAITRARLRAYTLLNRQRLSIDEGRVAELGHIGDIVAQRDDALRCQMEQSRFEAALIRG